MNTSRIIPKENSQSCQRWQAPHLQGSEDVVSLDNQRVVSSGLVTAKQLDAIQQQAYEDGFERGRKDGLEIGRKEGMQGGEKEVHEQIRQLHQLMQTFARPLEELDQQVVDELAALAIAVAKQLVRREIKTEPGEIVAVVQEAMTVLPTDANDVRLELHPEDAALIRDVLEFSDTDRSWKISEDPTLSRGGCRLSTVNSTLDATLEKRFNSVVASVMGGERQQDQKS